MWALHLNEMVYLHHPLSATPLFWWKERGNQEALIWMKNSNLHRTLQYLLLSSATIFCTSFLVKWLTLSLRIKLISPVLVSLEITTASSSILSLLKFSILDCLGSSVPPLLSSFAFLFGIGYAHFLRTLSEFLKLLWKHIKYAVN